MATATTKRNLTPAIIIAAVVAVIVAAAAIIAVAAGGSDEADAPVAVAEQFDVTVKGTVLPPKTDSPSDPAVGMMAPELLGSNFDGTPRVVTPAGGQPQLVIFLAHWCPACNQEVPELVEWHESGRVPANLKVTAVSTAVREGSANYPPSRWIQRRNWPVADWPVMADSPQSTAGNAYGVTSFPTTVVVGSDGRVLARTSGVLGLEAYEAFVNAAIALDVN